jgi:glc operon protein GlcG
MANHDHRLFDHVAGIADSVLVEAERMGADVAIVATDLSGRVILAYRTDQCSYTALEPARRKAVTSASMAAPTSFVASVAATDPVAAQALAASPDMLAVPGGYPIVLDHVLVGGIGVAGGHYGQDHMILAKAFVAEGELPAPMFHMSLGNQRAPMPAPPGSGEL